MRSNKLQEQWIKQALQQVFAEEQKQLMENDDSPPLSPDFEVRLKNRIAQEKRSPRRKWTRTLRVLVAAVLVLLLLLFCTGMAYPAIMKRLINCMKKTDEQSTKFVFAVDGEERKKQSIPQYYTLAQVPEDYMLVYIKETPDYANRIWKRNGSETYISLTQVPFNVLYVMDTEDCLAEKVKVNGYDATLYTKQTGAGGQRLLWHTDECVFSLVTSGKELQGLDVRELVQGITMIEPPDET